MGDVDGASDVIARWHESGAPNAPDESWVLRLEDSVEFQGPRGYWSWTLDRLTMYDEQGMRVPRVEIAAAHAALGNDDEAFTYLFEALERGEPALLTLRSDPVWDDLRDDPRYRRVAEEARALRFAPARRPGQGSGPGR
ncbi:MAG: hypothetical protein GWN07_02180 [Actinobacteria bacterium]|nr:hypothetical protein [Actinomycetota bacterium]NIS36727.1 hypothetical protein [Actinomycetota bacterium]NIT93985.1 hypothetical protein [Actinomycetota bacterium]NIU71218.1 hypothetical protein [Actinomycetota bacterium]NIV54123.1 hypothetical protein [Actinomycetota bacterium]